MLLAFLLVSGLGRLARLIARLDDRDVGHQNTVGEEEDIRPLPPDLVLVARGFLHRRDAERHTDAADFITQHVVAARVRFTCELITRDCVMQLFGVGLNQFAAIAPCGLNAVLWLDNSQSNAVRCAEFSRRHRAVVPKPLRVQVVSSCGLLGIIPFGDELNRRMNVENGKVTG